MGKRMDDWLRNMDDWNISRRRYYGLPLPFYPCSCGHLNVIGSKAELAERALEGLDQLQELRRPWIDRVPIRCEDCGEPVTRVIEVGDVWLDAGIVPFSTLGWQSPEWVEQGYATGAAKGLTTADLPDNAYWEKWFPADWVTEMREQIRLWFYSQFFMSVVLVGRSPYKRVLGYEKMLDEHGREMHGSWGNMIDAEDAFARMGADVMRWQFCAQPPDRNLLFGFGPAHEIKRKLLTFWNSVKFFVDYANIEGFEPVPGDLERHRRRSDAARPLARRADARARPRGRGGVRGDAHRERDRAPSTSSSTTSRTGTSAARAAGSTATTRPRFGRSGTRSSQSLRVIAPVMPFLADHLWWKLVPGREASVHLSGWPEVADPDLGLLAGDRRGSLGRRARPAGALARPVSSCASRCAG